MKLNLGCGTEKIKGFKGVDIREDVNPDIVDDVIELKTVRDSSCSEIRAAHVLEHFPFWKTQQVVNTWKSKLEKGGKIVVLVPNMLYIIDKFNKLNEKKVEFSDFHKMVALIYGNQDHAYNYHYTCFVPDYLRHIFETEGFKDVEIIDCGLELKLTAYKK